MATIKKNKDGSVDKRTKEYKEMCENLAKARKAKKPAIKKTKDGAVDKRTKEYKEMCENLAKARKAKNSLKNRIKRLFK